MTEEREWQDWRDQETQSLGELIGWAGTVFSTCEVRIEGSRHYGTALLAHGIENARAIRLCLRENLTGPALALARTQYEAVLRGHIIIHEIELEMLNKLLVRTQEWRKLNPLQQSPPSIQLKGKKWRCVARGTQDDPNFSEWRILQSDMAIGWQESVVGIGLLHDLTHGGMTQALQMIDDNGEIGSSLSAMNQTLLLYFAERTVMFAIMMWPGAMQKYDDEIEQRAKRIFERARSWEREIQSS